MTVYVTSDHGGFEAKQRLVAWLHEAGYAVEDLGAPELKPDDDYVEYGIALGERVAAESDAKGIALCRNGQGINIAANKVRGIRAASAWNEAVARSSREDDDANVLSLAADVLSFDELAAITDTWLTTAFSGEQRHVRRLAKLANYDATR